MRSFFLASITGFILILSVGVVLAKSSLNDVDSYRDFTAESGSNTSIANDSILPKLLYRNKFRLALSVGGSWRTIPIPEVPVDELIPYYRGLKSGFFYSADLAFFPSDKAGVGVKISQFNSENSIPVQVVFEDGSIERTSLRDEIRMNYYGIYWANRSALKNGRNGFYFNLGAGYITYYQVTEFLFPVLYEGNTFAAMVDLGYDFAIGNHFAVGLQVGFVGAMLSEFSLTILDETTTIDLPKGERESLTRFDYGVGLRFNF